jgi:hypothetical protein
MSSTSGRTRWMISATAIAWALFGVERSATSCPSALRFMEALNVANRTTVSDLASAAATEAVPSEATTNARLSVNPIDEQDVLLRIGIPLSRHEVEERSSRRATDRQTRGDEENRSAGLLRHDARATFRSLCDVVDPCSVDYIDPRTTSSA